MEYSVKSIEQRQATVGELKYIVFDIVLDESVNGVGCASIPADDEHEAILKLKQMIEKGV